MHVGADVFARTLRWVQRAYETYSAWIRCAVKKPIQQAAEEKKISAVHLRKEAQPYPWTRSLRAISKRLGRDGASCGTSQDGPLPQTSQKDFYGKTTWAR